MDYISSGNFQKDLEGVFGPLEAQEPDDEFQEGKFRGMSDELVREMRAFTKLVQEYDIPELGQLNTGALCSLPEAYDEDEEEILDDGDCDEDGVELLMTTFNVLDTGGQPYYTVGDGGVYAAFYGPWDIRHLSDDIEGFFRLVVRMAAVAAGKAEASSVASDFAKELETFGDEPFVKRVLES